jgi:hypothetical protein
MQCSVSALAAQSRGRRAQAARAIVRQNDSLAMVPICPIFTQVTGQSHLPPAANAADLQGPATTCQPAKTGQSCN